MQKVKKNIFLKCKKYYLENILIWLNYDIIVLKKWWTKLYIKLQKNISSDRIGHSENKVTNVWYVGHSLYFYQITTVLF